MIEQYKELTLEEIKSASHYVRSHTHVWKGKVKSKGGFYFTDIYDQYELKLNLYDPKEILRISLLPCPETLEFRDEYFERVFQYDQVLNTFFLEVLTANRDEEVSGLSISTFDQVIIHKDKLKLIEATIREYGFEKNIGFFIHLISRMQYVYLKDIEFHQSKEETQRRAAFPNEVSNLKNAIKKNDVFSPDRIKTIKFTYQKSDTITIKDYGLIIGISDSIKNYWGYGSKENWEKHLDNMVHDSESRNQLDYFQRRIATAMHAFLISTKLFNQKGIIVSDKEAYFIARLIHLADIPTQNKQGKEHEIVSDKPNIISLIKSWVQRTEIIKKKTVYEIEPNLSELEKYFDPSFLQGATKVISNNRYDLILNICEKQDILNIKDDIAFIFGCLKQRVRGLKWFEDQIGNKSKSIPELEGLVKLLEPKTFNDLISFSFTDKKDNKTYSLKSDILKSIIIDALTQHHNKSREEYIDLWKIDFKEDPISGSTDYTHTNQLLLPGERFLPSFCYAMDQYLESHGISNTNQLDTTKNKYLLIYTLLYNSQMINYCASADYIRKIKNWILIRQNFIS